MSHRKTSVTFYSPYRCGVRHFLFHSFTVFSPGDFATVESGVQYMVYSEMNKNSKFQLALCILLVGMNCMNHRYIPLFPERCLQVFLAPFEIKANSPLG